MKKILLLCLISFIGFGQSSTKDTTLYRKGYTIIYNDTLKRPRMVIWSLTKQDITKVADRQNDFRPDRDLPKGFYQVTPSDYRNSGFDKGHYCNSADRSSSVELNQETFLMSNMMPQAPKNNEHTWEGLEEYCRDLVKKGYELLIIAGTYGEGGFGKKGYFTKIGHGISVPAHTFKVIRIMKAEQETTFIAVDMPNSQDICLDWRTYITTKEVIEASSNLNFSQFINN